MKEQLQYNNYQEKYFKYKQKYLNLTGGTYSYGCEEKMSAMLTIQTILKDFPP